MRVNLSVPKPPAALIPKVRQGWMGYLCGIPVVILLSFSLAGCFNPELEQAFKGGLVPEKSNQVISDYCQGCHIHRNFDGDKHVSEIREKYRRPFFRKARECRSCHYLERQWVHNQFTRKTRMPEDANRGHYQEFEKE